MTNPSLQRMALMQLLSVSNIMKLHNRLYDKTGGSLGLRDVYALNSCVESVFQTFEGKDLYPDIEDKITCLCYLIIRNHPFIDGNKRAGIAALLVFSKIAGIELCYSQQELEELGIGIAYGSISFGEVGDWVKAHKKQ